MESASVVLETKMIGVEFGPDCQGEAVENVSPTTSSNCPHAFDSTCRRFIPTPGSELVRAASCSFV